MIKPPPLSKGDKVAVVSPSWGGPGTLLYRYEAGKKELEQKFGVEVIEMPNALKSAEWLDKNPKARADDIMMAFSDPEIKGIIASIGGDDSIRLLPYLDLDSIKNNPKIFMGYSDTTTLHFACYKVGLTSFYGPSIMSGFAENCGINDYIINSVKSTLFSNSSQIEIPQSDEWTAQHLEWNKPSNQTIKRKMTPNTGWKTLNGTGNISGHLIGGCIDVLEMLKGSSIWPTLDDWNGAILFLETSEENPPENLFRQWIRSYGALGILQVINGVIIGRPDGGTSENELKRYDTILRSIIVDELGLKDMPILSQLDFGHTYPMFVIPYGVQAQINCNEASLTFLESGTK